MQGPLGSALSPDGSRLLTVSSGAARFNSVDLFDLSAHQRVSYVGYDGQKAPGEAVFYGIVYAPDGRHAWASGGGQNVVHELEVDGNTVRETGEIPPRTSRRASPTDARRWVIASTWPGVRDELARPLRVGH